MTKSPKNGQKPAISTPSSILGTGVFRWLSHAFTIPSIRDNSLIHTGAPHARGNVFALLFGAVALTGVLAAVGMQTLTGPVTTITRVTQKNIADTQLLMNAKIIVNAAIAGDDDGDPDDDGLVELAPWPVVGGGETPPTNGGFLPADLGLSLTDPWGSKYGYCVWDHGTTNTSTRRLTGDNSGTTVATNQPILAIIAAGPDKVFQTTCPPYTSGMIELTKSPGSDDLWFTYTYAQASASSNGLWTLNTADKSKAELKASGGGNAPPTVTIDRDTGVGDFIGITTSTIAAKIGEFVSMDGGLKLDTATTCDNGAIGVIRFNAGSTPKKIEFCDGAGWQAVGSDLWMSDTPLTKVYHMTGNVGIGTNAPAEKLDVTGNVKVTGNIAASGTLGVTGNTTLGGTLGVTGASTLASLGVTNNATVGGTLGVTGNTALTGTLGVTGDTTLSNADVTGDFSVATNKFMVDGATGNTDVAGTLDVAGASTLGALDAGASTLASLDVTGNTTLGGTLAVTGNTAIDTDTFYVNVATNAVGIGTASPGAKLEVAGGIKFGLQNTCDAGGANDGTMRYNPSTLSMEYCIAASWKKMSSIDLLDDVGDVEISEVGTPSDNALLAWDAGGNRWVAKTVNSVGNATIAVPGDDGSVQFKTGTALDADEDYFVYDKATHRLAIGGDSPNETLDVTGTAAVSGDADIGGALGVTGVAAFGNSVGVTGNLVVDTTTLAVNATSNSVGVGTASPASMFEVASSGYAQFSKNFAGAPTAGDCDDAAEVGRMTYDTTNNRWFVCTSASGWVYTSMGASGGAANAGGSDTQVQFNDGGALAGAATMSWDKTTGFLGVGTLTPDTLLTLSSASTSGQYVPMIKMLQPHNASTNFAEIGLSGNNVRGITVLYDDGGDKFGFTTQYFAPIKFYSGNSTPTIQIGYNAGSPGGSNSVLLNLTGSAGAASGSAVALHIPTTLTANVNGDALYGFYINPAYDDNGKTGVTRTDIGFDGTVERSIVVARNSVNDTAGSNLAITAGAATAGASDKGGGSLTLSGGVSTGNGMSSIQFKTARPGQGAGTTDRIPAVSMTLSSNALTLPSGPTTQQPGQAGMQASVDGMIRYDTDKGKYQAYQSGAWQDILTSAPGNSISWSSLSDPTDNMALNMGAYTSTFTFGNATGANNLFNFVDTASNTGTGYLMNIATATGSTLKPLHISAAGVEAIMVDAAGNVGVGTTTPNGNAKMDINGVLRLPANGQNLQFSDGGTSIGHNGGALNYVGGSGHTFFDGSNNRLLQIDTNGKVTFKDEIVIDPTTSPMEIRRRIDTPDAASAALFIHAGDQNFTNRGGGDLTLAGGRGTGNMAGGKISLQTAAAGSSGNTINPLSERMVITSTGDVGIGTSTPSTILSFGGDANRVIGMERTVAGTDGLDLTVRSGGAKSGATDKAGGSLFLSSGTATGDGMSSIQFQTVKPGQGTGTTDRAPAVSMILSSNALTIPSGPTSEQPGQAGMQASVAGMLRYDTDEGKFQAYQSGAWQDVLTSGGGGVLWSSLGDPDADLALTMADYTSTFTYGATTGANNLFNLTDTASNTGTGYLMNIGTATGSTLKPLNVFAKGRDAFSVTEDGDLVVGHDAMNNGESNRILLTGLGNSAQEQTAAIALDADGNYGHQIKFDFWGTNNGVFFGGMNGGTVGAQTWYNNRGSGNPSSIVWHSTDTGMEIYNWYTQTSGSFLTMKNNNTELMRVMYDGKVGIGTNAPAAKLESLATTEQLRLSYDASNYMSVTVDSTGQATFANTAPLMLFNNEVVTLGGLRTSSSGGNSNLWIPSSAGLSVAQSASSLQLGSSTNIQARIIERGSTNATLTADAAYASHLIGQQTITEAATGTHPILAQLAVRPLVVTDAAATVTSAATVYIENASNAVAGGGSASLSLWVDAGESRFDDYIRLTKRFFGAPTAGDCNAAGHVGRMTYDATNSRWYVCTSSDGWVYAAMGTGGGAAIPGGNDTEVQFNDNGALAGAANMVWDKTNNRLGLGTATPAGILDVQGGTAASGNGTDITLAAQNGFGTGNTDGGNILLDAGVPNGTGTKGGVLIGTVNPTAVGIGIASSTVGAPLHVFGADATTDVVAAFEGDGADAAVRIGNRTNIGVTGRYLELVTIYDEPIIRSVGYGQNLKLTSSSGIIETPNTVLVNQGYPVGSNSMYTLRVGHGAGQNTNVNPVLSGSGGLGVWAHDINSSLLSIGTPNNPHNTPLLIVNQDTYTRFVVAGNGRVGIGTDTPSTIMSFGGDANNVLGMERTVAGTDGLDLTVRSGGAKSGATDKAGGSLFLSSGIATGDAMSSIQFQTVMPGQGTGTTDRNPAVSMVLSSNALTIPSGPTTEQPGQAGMQASTAGMLRYDTTVNKFQAYQAGAWQDILTSAPGNAIAWSALSDPTANLGLTMGGYTSTFTYGAATGANNLFNLTDTNSNTGTGYLMNLTTGTGSTLKPFHVAAAGVDAITVTAGARVGIGETTPSYRFVVAQNNDGADVIGLHLRNHSTAAGTSASLSFGPTTSLSGITAKISGLRVSSTEFPLTFSTSDGTTLAEKMRLNTAGHLIIGSGEGSATVAGGTVRSADPTGTDKAGAGLTIRGGLGTGTGATGDVTIQRAPVGTTGTTQQTAAAAVTVKGNTGNVGIGTTAPTVRLHVLTSGTELTPSTPSNVSALFQGTGSAGTNNGITIAAGSSASSIINFAKDSGSNWEDWGQIRFFHANGTMQFSTSATKVAYLSTSGLYLDGEAARGFGMTRMATAGTTGSDMTVSAGGAKSATADVNGGNLVLASGIATGTGSSAISFQTATAQGSTASTDNTPTTKMTITGAGNVGIGTAAPASQLNLAGNKLSTAWTSSGIGFVISPATYTDTSSSGTINSVVHSIGAPTLAASNAVSTNTAVTLRVNAPVAGTNVTLGGAHALQAIGNFNVSGKTSLGTQASNVPSAVLHMLGDQSFSGTQWDVGEGAMLRINPSTLTATTGSGTIATRVANSFGIPTFASTNANALTNAATVYIDGAPTAGTNTTITNAQALHVAAGTSYFGGSVGVGTTAPNASAALDVSSTTQGFLPPRMTTTEVGNIASPANGLFVYDTTVGRYKAYQGGAWSEILTSAPGNGISWSSLSNPSANLALSMAGYTTTMTYGNATGASTNMFTLADTASNTGTGYLLNVATGTSSAAKPFRVAAAGVEAIAVDATGKVGIGTTAPSYKMHVVETKTDTSAGNVVMARDDLSANPGANSASTFIARMHRTDVPSGNGFNITGAINSSSNYTTHTGTGTIATAYGSTNLVDNLSATGVITYAAGANNAARANSAGTITGGYGSSNIAQMLNASSTMTYGYGSYNAAQTTAGTMTNGIGSYNAVMHAAPTTMAAGFGSRSYLSVASGSTITTAYGFYADMNNAGTVGTWYGLHIPSVTNTGTITNKYPIYVADTGNNYFAGNVGIGTAAPASLLDVTKAGATSIARFANGVSPSTDYLELSQASAATSTINRYAATTAQIDMSPIPADGTSGASVRFFRSTSTSGAKNVQFLRGDNSTTVDAQIAVGTSGSSYFAANGGNVGIGNAAPAYKLDVLGTSTDNSGSPGLALNYMNVTPSALSSGVYTNVTNDTRITGGVSTDITGSIKSLYNYARHAGSGTLDSGYGSSSLYTATSTGNTTYGYGASNEVRSSAANTIANAYGAQNRAIVNGTGATMTAGTGAYNIAQVSNGTITNATGSRNTVYSSTTTTIANAKAVLAEINNTSTAAITNAYGMQSVLDNSGGGAITNWYGLHIPAVTGTAPTNKYPIYVADAGINYFAGSVAIGTPSPLSTAKLDIYDATTGLNTVMRIRSAAANDGSGGNAVLRIVSDNSANANIDFGDSGNSAIGRIQYVNADDSMRFTTNAAEAMRITSAGRVGIGTTTPNASAALDVYSTTQGFLPPRMTTTEVGNIASPANGLFVYDTTVGRYKAYQGGAWSEILTSAPGNGISWSSLSNPVANLALSMAGYTTSMTYGNATGASTNMFTLADTASNTGTGYLLNLTTGTSSTLKPLHVAAAGVEALFVNAAGNVGMGTTSPIGKVHISTGSSGQTVVGNNADELVLENNTHAGMTILGGTTSTAKINFGDSGDAAGGRITYDNTDDSMSIHTNGTLSMKITSAGRIAIGGITTPSYLLSIDGDNNRVIGQERAVSGTNGSTLSLIAGGAKSATADLNGGTLTLSSGIATGTGSSNIVFQTATAQGSTATTDNTPTTKMTILGSGNVGIGTTAPQFKTHIAMVNSGNEVLPLHIQNDAVSDGTAVGLSFGNSNVNTSTTAKIVNYRAATNDRGLAFSTYDGTSTTEKLRIRGNGNVGIGTTSPTYNLSFNGEAAQTIGQERMVTAGTAGSALTLRAGGAKSGATDANGGDLYLTSGTSTGSGSSNIYFQTAAAGASATTDRTPATAMTILGNNNVGIGTTTPTAPLDVRGTSTITSGGAYNTYKVLSANPSAAGTGSYYGDYSQVTSAGTYDMTTMRGYRALVQHNTAAAVGNTRGIDADANNAGTGTITDAMGGNFQASQANTTGSISRAYGVYGTATNNRASGTGISTAYGLKGRVDNAAAGTITNGYGSYNEIWNSGGGTMTNATGSQGTITNSAGGTITNAYGLYSDLTNNGTAVTNWYGLYIASVSGTLPATLRRPIYSADAGDSVLAGGLGIGSTSALASGTIFNVANGGYAQFAKNFAGAPTGTDCDAAGEVGRMTYDTTNNRWYVCTSTSGWVYASMGTNGGSSVAGSDKQIQFNDGGTTLAGAALLGWDKTGSGKLGIGTLSPSYTLDVRVADTATIPTNISGFDGQAQIYNTSDSANYSALKLQTRTTNSTMALLGLGYGTGLGDGYMFFRIRDGSTTNKEVMRLTGDGNVGIGTATTPARLSLGGNKSAAAWTNGGIALNIAPATYTDTTSSGSLNTIINYFGQPTYASSSATTPNVTNVRIDPPLMGANASAGSLSALTVLGSTTSYGIVAGIGKNSFSYSTTPASSGLVTLTGTGSSVAMGANGTMLAVLNNTVTDTSSSAGTVATRVSNSFAQPTFASTNAVTYTNASNVYIADAPAAGTNTTITNPYALYVAAGNSYFAGNVTMNPADSNGSVNSPDITQGVLKFNNRFDNTGGTTANKIILYDNGSSRYGIGVSAASMDFFTGSSGGFNFYTGHQSEGTPGTMAFAIDASSYMRSTKNFAGAPTAGDCDATGEIGRMTYDTTNNRWYVCTSTSGWVYAAMGTSGGTAAAAGSDKQIQFNDGGTTLAGAATLGWDKTNSRLGVGTLTPTYDVSLGGEAARTIGMERTSAGTTGYTMTLQAGGAKSATADLDGGNLTLSSGTATGTGSSTIYFRTATPGATGTTDRAPSQKMAILGNGNVGIGILNPATLLQVGGTAARYSAFTDIGRAIIVANDNIAATPALTLRNTFDGGYGVGIKFEMGYGGTASTEGTASTGAVINAIQEQVWTSTAATRDSALILGTTLNGTGIEGMRITSAGNVGIGVTSPSAKLDALGYNIQIGADWVTGTARTDATGKGGYLTVPHYTNAEEPMAVIAGMNSSIGNSIFYGGGTSAYNAATDHRWYTGATSTTVTGTVKMQLLNDGTLQLGEGEASATPVAATLRGANGAGTDIAGGSLTIRGGRATGNAASGDIAFQYAPAGSTGTTLQTPATAMTIKGGTGNVGIGTTTPTSPLDVIVSNTSTANATVYNMYNQMSVAPLSTSDSNFNGVRNYVVTSGASDITGLITGAYAYGRHGGTGLLTTGYGANNFFAATNTGNTTSAYGSYNEVQNSAANTISTTYGALNRARTNHASAVMTTATGAYNEARVNTGTMTTAYGSRNLVVHGSTTAMTSAFAMSAEINNNSTASITNAYSIYGSLDNTGGGAITNWYGLYIPAAAGTAPTNKYPLYIADTGNSRMAGSLGVGSVSAVASGTLFNVANGGYAQFAKNFAGAPTSTDCDAAGEVGRMTYDTTNNRWYVCTSASGWVYAAMGTSGGGGGVAGSDKQIQFNDGGSTMAGAATLGWDKTNSRLGVGTLSPAGKLDVRGALNVTMEANAFGTTSNYTAFVLGATTGATANNGGLYAIGRKDKANEPFTALSGWDDGTNRQLYFGGGGWSVPDATEMMFYTASAYNESNDAAVERMRISSAGYVGIGTSSPGAPLQVNGTSVAINTADATAGVNSTDTGGGADKGGSFAFGGHDGSTADRVYAKIMGAKENGTSGNYDGYLAFATRQNGGSPMERMRISSGGNLGIGTSSPSYDLSFGGDANRQIALERATANTAGRNLIITAGGAKSGSTDYVGGNLILSGGTATGSGTSSISLMTAGGGTSGTSDKSATTKVTIDGAGNVGIGKTTPRGKVDVFGDGGAYGPIFNPGGGSIQGEYGSTITDVAAGSVARIAVGQQIDSVSAAGNGYTAFGQIISRVTSNHATGSGGAFGLVVTDVSNVLGNQPGAHAGGISVSDITSNSNGNAYGLRVGTVTYSGGNSSSYSTGLLIENAITNTNTAANAYAINSLSTAKSYFAGNVGIGTTTPTDLLNVGSGGYPRFEKAFAGAPTSTDCDAAGEVGRMTYDTTNNRWYVCTTSSGWVYAAMGTSGGTMAAAGSDKQIQFNDGGSTLAGAATLGWDKTNSRLGVGTLSPGHTIGFSGEAANTIGMNRTTAGTTGYGLTVSAGGAKSATADLAGGNLTLSSGTATGTGSSDIVFQTATAQGSTASTDNAPTTKMTLTGSGRLGIGTTSPSQPLHVVGTGQFVASGTDRALMLSTSSSSDETIQMYRSANTSPLQISFQPAGSITVSNKQFFAGMPANGNRFVVSAGTGGSGTTYFAVGNGGSIGLGRNTETFTYPITLNGDAAVTIGQDRTTTNATPGYSLTLLAGGARINGTDLNGGDLTLSSGMATGAGSSNIYFKTATAGATGNTDRTPSTSMTILGSGNVGIGTTTPSSSLSFGGNSTRHISMERSGSGAGNSMYLTAGGAASGGTDLTGGHLYMRSGISTGTGSSSLYFQTQTPGSTGTADNSYATRMAIGGNGYVGIGTTGPTGLLHAVVSGGRQFWMDPLQGNILIQSNDNNTLNTVLTLRNTYDGGYGVSMNMNLGYGGSGGLVGTATSGSRISTLPDQAHTSTASTQDAYLRFDVAQDGTLTERMRLTSGGTLMVGRTTQSTSTPAAVLIQHTNATGYGLVINSDSTSASSVVRFDNSNGNVGSITVTGSATAYNTSSDRRLKDNIAPTKAGLDTVLKLPVYDFAFKADPKHKLQTGFMAQELRKVFPDAVTTNGDDGEVALTGDKGGWSVDYGRVTPILVKAVQELKSLFDGLAEKVTQLFDMVAQLRAENAELRGQVDNLKAQNMDILKRLEALEAK